MEQHRRCIKAEARGLVAEAPGVWRYYQGMRGRGYAAQAHARPRLRPPGALPARLTRPPPRARVLGACRLLEARLPVGRRRVAHATGQGPWSVALRHLGPTCGCAQALLLGRAGRDGCRASTPAGRRPVPKLYGPTPREGWGLAAVQFYSHGRGHGAHRRNSVHTTACPAGGGGERRALGLTGAPVEGGGGTHKCSRRTGSRPPGTTRIPC